MPWNLLYVIGARPWFNSIIFSSLYRVCEAYWTTSMWNSLHMAMMLWSRTRPKGSGSSSNVKHVVCHSLNSFGNASAGWPRITKRREFRLRRLRSKSSRHCSRNLNNVGGWNQYCMLCYKTDKLYLPPLIYSDVGASRKPRIDDENASECGGLLQPTQQRGIVMQS